MDNIDDYAIKCEIHKTKKIWKGGDSLYAKYYCQECINKTHWSKISYYIGRGITEIPLAFFFVVFWAIILLMLFI